MKKHVESRWLSIDCSLVRILEQMENLRDCFLKEIPKQKGFNQKNGLANDDLYKAEKPKAEKPKAKIYMSFVVFISQSFNCFLKLLQTSLPMIHRIYPMCLQLVHELLDKVIKESLLKKVKLLKKEGKSVSGKKLKEIELQNEEWQKVLHLTFKFFCTF